jgi:hypothetical protein
MKKPLISTNDAFKIALQSYNVSQQITTYMTNDISPYDLLKNKIMESPVYAGFHNKDNSTKIYIVGARADLLSDTETEVKYTITLLTVAIDIVKNRYYYASFEKANIEGINDAKGKNRLYPMSLSDQYKMKDIFSFQTDKFELPFD